MSLGMGLVAFLLANVLRGVLTSRVPRSHARYRERALERLHYLLNLQAEQADVEQELAELNADIDAMERSGVVSHMNAVS